MNSRKAPAGQPGELVMRGPQFMLGYWKEPQATAAVLRDGWYWSGDIVTRDREGFYRVVDRRKEMIKYKGFAVAPAEVEGGSVGASGGEGMRRSGANHAPTREKFRWPSSRCGMDLSTAASSRQSSAVSWPIVSRTTSSRAKFISSMWFQKPRRERFFAVNFASK